MSNQPWSKFFWSDWASDPALRLCSLAAQGLWMRCLCIAAESNPIGYVTVNGRPLDGQDLARVAGVSVPEAETLLSELDRNGVFSRDRSGCIYSRRMVRDQKSHNRSQKNGKMGGNPSLRKHNGNSEWVNPPLNVEDKPQKPEARKKANDKDSPRPSSPRAPPSTLSSVEKLYAFEHGCVRLTEPDIAKWRKAFPHVAVEAELMSSEPWLAKQTSWFNAAAGKLAKLERQAIERINASARGPPKKRMIPSPLGGWVESPGFDMANQPIPDDDDD